MRKYYFFVFIVSAFEPKVKVTKLYHMHISTYLIVFDEILEHACFGQKLRKNKNTVQLVSLGLQIKLTDQQLLEHFDRRQRSLILRSVLEVHFLQRQQPLLGGQTKQRRTSHFYLRNRSKSMRKLTSLMNPNWLPGWNLSTPTFFRNIMSPRKY